MAACRAIDRGQRRSYHPAGQGILGNGYEHLRHSFVPVTSLPNSVQAATAFMESDARSNEQAEFVGHSVYARLALHFALPPSPSARAEIPTDWRERILERARSNNRQLPTTPDLVDRGGIDVRMEFRVVDTQWCYEQSLLVQPRKRV